MPQDDNAKLVDIYVGLGNNDPGSPSELVLEVRSAGKAHRINLTDAQIDKMLREIGRYRSTEGTGKTCHPECELRPGHAGGCMDPMGSTL